MSDEKKIKAQMAQCKGSLTKAEKFWQEQLKGPSENEAIISRLRQIDVVLTKYNGLSLELLLLDEETTADNSDNFQDTFACDDFEDRALAISSKLQKLLNTNTSKPQQASESNQRSANLVLPQIEIPVYDGKGYTKYQSFIELFYAVIHTNTKLVSIQKLFYLRKFLTGEPLSLIEGLPLIGESYDKALELLKNRYDNKFLIITNHVQALLDIKPVNNSSASNMREFISQSRQHLGALKTLGQPTEKWDMVILPILLRKIDQFSCRAYHSERDDVELPKLEDFFTYMERRASSFEESQKSEDGG